jgi:hypothetical protein
MIDASVGRSTVEDRGEFSLLLAGTSMGLRPSYEAIDAIEKTLGRGAVDITRQALAGKLSMGETAQVACECIRAWGREAEDKGAAASNPVKVGQLIYDSPDGLHGALQTIAAMLSLVVTGGYTSSGELKPATTMTTTEKAPVVG